MSNGRRPLLNLIGAKSRGIHKGVQRRSSGCVNIGRLSQRNGPCITEEAICLCGVRDVDGGHVLCDSLHDKHWNMLIELATTSRLICLNNDL